MFAMSWRLLRLPFMLWSSCGFFLLAAGNGLLLLDKSFYEATDLTGYRVSCAALGVAMLVRAALVRSR